MPVLKFKNSPRWYVDFTYGGRRRKWAVSRDKRVALDFERQLLRLIDYHAQALPLPSDVVEWLERQSPANARRFADIGIATAAGRPIPAVEHLSAYIEHLKQRECAPRHVAQVESRIRAVLDSGPLTAEHIESALAELRESRMATTVNKYLASCRSFARWLARAGIIVADPLASLRPIAELGDRRRRALTTAEVDRLLAVPSRLHDAYRIALETGLRLGEIRQLTSTDFRLSGKSPIVRVRAAVSKNRKAVDQPIPTGSVTHYRRVKLPIFAPPHAAALMRDDLKTAKVRYQTPDGVVDFHALRHTYITRLALAGVAPAVLKRLARHSSIQTTLGYYAHVDAAALRQAAETASTEPGKHPQADESTNSLPGK